MIKVCNAPTAIRLSLCTCTICLSVDPVVLNFSLDYLYDIMYVVEQIIDKNTSTLFIFQFVCHKKVQSLNKVHNA